MSTKKSCSPLFKQHVAPEKLNALSANTLARHLDIQFTELGDGFIKATMPVDHRTQQPQGFLHGGASVALAETLGSVAATLCVDYQSQYCVGIEINANHIKSTTKGLVTGIARPLHVGKKTHVWEIRITDERNELTTISRITMAVIDRH